MPSHDLEDVYRPPIDAGYDSVRRPDLATGEGIWREGALLVVAKGGHAFPDRCVVCNAPAEGYRVKRTAYWHPGWIYLLILVSLLIYAVVALVIRKSIAIEFGLCPAHKQRRHIGLTLAIGGFLASFVAMFVAAANGSELMLFALLGMIACPVVGLIMARTLTPKYIDDQIARFTVGDRFLASF